MSEYLEGLRDGKFYRFGTTVLSDQGIELVRKSLFTSNERVFCPWSEIVTWNVEDVFIIGKKKDKELSAAFSFKEEDNIHVLETAIRMFSKKCGETRLSSLLDKQ